MSDNDIDIRSVEPKYRHTLDRDAGATPGLDDVEIPRFKTVANARPVLLREQRLQRQYVGRRVSVAWGALVGNSTQLFIPEIGRRFTSYLAQRAHACRYWRQDRATRKIQ